MLLTQLKCSFVERRLLRFAQFSVRFDGRRGIDKIEQQLSLQIRKVCAFFPLTLPPQLTQTFAQLRVLQVRMLARQLSAGLLGVHHESVHRPLDVVALAARRRPAEARNESKCSFFIRERDKCRNGKFSC